MLEAKYKESLINNINTFCKNINCSNCGGSYDYQTFTCCYCGCFNGDLKSSYELILSIIPLLNKDNIDKELALYLYKLTNSSDIFNKTLEQLDLTKETKNIIKELESTDEYNDLDVKLLECIFSNDNFIGIDNVLRDVILRNVILRKNTLSKELIEKVVNHLVLAYIRKINKDSKFYVQNLRENEEGVAFHYYVYLNKEVMDEFYDKGSIAIFYVLPHEMQHTYRSYLESEGKFTSIYDLLALKEHLLRKYNKDIYYNDKNYVKNLHEIEANIFSYQAGTNYLKSLGFKVDDVDALKLSNLIVNDLTRLEDPLREIEGNLVNINELFATYIEDKPDLFHKYPQLRYEFKEDNGRVIYKSYEELIDEYNFNNDKNLDEIYLTFINNAKKRTRINVEEVKK